MEHSFTTWEQHRRHLTPEADRILPLVAAAGTTGMTRKQLGHAVHLDREVLDNLLDGMVKAGLLSVTWEYGVPVFRAGVGISPSSLSITRRPA